MTRVRRQDGESLEDLLLRFKHKCRRDSIMLDLNKHRYFLNKAAERERKSVAAQKRTKKNQKSNRR